MKASMRIEFWGVIVPSTHVAARSRLSRPLPERLEQHVFIECEKESVILVELLAHGPFQQLNLAISKLIERRGDCNARARRAPAIAQLRACE